MTLLPAAIGIILNANHTQVLLVKRRDVPVWVLPGGGVEPGETPQEAVIREILEETGFHIKVLRQSAEYSPVNRLAAQTSVFICQIQAGDICLSSETAAIAFFPCSKLPATLFPPHAQWLKEALTHQILIQRALTEVSYSAIGRYFLRHPWQVLRFAWTRFIKK